MSARSRAQRRALAWPLAVAVMPGLGCGADAYQETRAPASRFADAAAVYEVGISKTCALNEGVCHNAKQYPDLSAPERMLDLVGAPCQIAPAYPPLTPDACEVPGDLLHIGSADHEILRVIVDDTAPTPLPAATLKLAQAPASLNAADARVRRLGPGGAEILGLPLVGVAITAGDDPRLVHLDFTGAVEPAVAVFMDPRSYHGEAVRQGDPNENGVAHAAPSPWALVTPGDPARSFLYKRLTTDQFGAAMPLLPRTWTPDATRAVYCWILGMPEGATPEALSLRDPIDYADCPPDPEAPPPGKGFAEVKQLLATRCAAASCHSSTIMTAAADLNLDPDAPTFTASVISAPSMQSPPARLIIPFDPAASYLLCKVDPSCEARAPATGIMPASGEPLTKAEIQTLSDWILKGASIEGW